MGTLGPGNLSHGKAQKDWSSVGAHGGSQPLKPNLSAGVVCQQEPDQHKCQDITTELAPLQRDENFLLKCLAVPPRDGEPGVTVTRAPA